MEKKIELQLRDSRQCLLLSRKNYKNNSLFSTAPPQQCLPQGVINGGGGNGGGGGGSVLFPSFSYNRRNFWLEYSTPPSTTEFYLDDDEVFTIYLYAY